MWPFQAGAVIVEFLTAKEVRGRESCYQELVKNYIEVDIIYLWQPDGLRFVGEDLLDLIDSWFSHFLVGTKKSAIYREELLIKMCGAGYQLE